MLTEAQRQYLSEPRIVDIQKLSEREFHRKLAFKISIQFNQLAMLIDSAAVGWRIYELMSLQRPGDLLNYLLVSPVEIDSEIEKVICDYNQDDFEIRYHPEKPLQTLPFTRIDQCFAWKGDDTDNWDEIWCLVADKGYWRTLILEIFPILREIQKQIAASTDSLVQRELRMIEQFTHPYMMGANPPRPNKFTELPPSNEPLSPVLVQYLQGLIQTGDIRSVSGSISDYYFWRSLIATQLARSEQFGLPPRRAFGLGCDDRGGPWCSLAFVLGAKIHEPYEGICGGDIFFMPSWFRFYVEAALSSGRLIAGTGGRHCRYLVTQRDLGELPFAQHRQFGDWHVYDDSGAAAPTNTFDDS